VIGSSGNDTLTSGSARNILSGDSGDDELHAGAGNDTLNGNGDDDLFVMDGNLTAPDKIDGGGGLDTVKLAGNYAAGVTLSAANFQNVETVKLTAGNDYRIVASPSTDQPGYLIDGSALGAGDTLIATVTGSVGMQIIGGAAADTLTGGTGADYFLGGAG